MNHPGIHGRASFIAAVVKLFALGWLVVGSAWAQPVGPANAIQLTPEERAWVAANPVVTIGNPPLPPYHFVEKGLHTGYQVEMLDAMLKQVGLRARYIELPLAALLDGMRVGTHDVIMDPIHRKEREEFIIFSERSFDITLGIFARYDRKDISDLASLKGKRIGSYRDYALEAKLRKLLPDATVVQANDSEGMLRLVSTGEADFCVVEVRAGEFILQREQISNVATKGAFMAPGETPARAHDYGVRKSAPLLASILDKSLRAMDPAARQGVWKRWFASASEANTNRKITLTDEERVWLAAGHTVRVRIADYAPYVISNPAPAGIVVDYLNAIAGRVGFRLEYVPARHGWTESIQDVAEQHQYYDLLPVMHRTPEREKRLALTKDILTSPLVIYIRNDSPLVNGLDALHGKTVAAESGFTVTDKLRASHPAIRILEVNQSIDALEAVATGQAQAYVGNLTHASYLIKQHRLNNLMVSAPTPFGDFAQTIAVRKDWTVLAGLIDKGFASMSPEEVNAINQKWGTVEMSQRVDYALVWQIALVSAIIFLALWYWNVRLSREIAHRHQIESDLRQAKEAAEMACRAKSTFLANMSHELRTPMNAIMGMTALAQRHADEPKLQDQLGKIESASRHLLHVINDILDISKIEAGRLTLEQTNFRLGEVLGNLTSMLGHKVAEKGLGLHVELPPALRDQSLSGDPLRLAQILLNLAGNALKFTQQGSITLGVRLVEETPADVLLRWEVRDSGIGISPEDQRRLFTAFEQADGSMTRKYGGTGLGLAISKRLVHMMNGMIGVESTPGAGSLFWFTVRLGKATTGAVSPAPTLTGESAEVRLMTNHSGKRILLAEDEPVNQEVSRGLIEDVGLQTDLAEDGAIAVELAKRNRYALILMDMQMPNLNGLDAARAIRAESLNMGTPILAMTANAFEEDRRTCIDAGMNDHIPKPVDPNQLFETLLKWLEKPGE
jgi:signal transduction histidine kinase/ActR/RegA family two-component response regulator